MDIVEDESQSSASTMWRSSHINLLTINMQADESLKWLGAILSSIFVFKEASQEEALRWILNEEFYAVANG